MVFSPPESVRDSGLRPAVVLPDSGWAVLFDGISLQGWHSYGEKEAGNAWQTDSGSIHLIPGVQNNYREQGGSDLVSNDTFSNFDLKMEWRIGKKANSGVLFYVQEDPAKYKESWNTGPEMLVCDGESNEDTHRMKQVAGDLYDLTTSRINAALPAMEWNQVEILCNHGQLDLYLNDTHIISTMLWDENWRKLIAVSKFNTMPDFGTFHSGRIALRDQGTEVWYRNIRVKKF